MTPEELEAKIRAAGVKAGQWSQVEAHGVKAEGLNDVVEGLKKLRDTLEGLAESDRKKVVELRTQISRMRRGGGK